MDVLAVGCPECGSRRQFKDGLRQLESGEEVQRFLCRDCGFRFSDPEKSYKGCRTIPDRQICVSLKDAKNLATATETKTVAGEGKPQLDVKEKIAHAVPQIEKLLTQVKGDGRTEGTVLNYRKTFKCLLKAGADLFDPENTKLVLADLKREDGTPYGNNTKKTMAAILDIWYDFNGIKWKTPKYVKEEKPIWIPPTGMLQQFTAALGKKMCCYCTLLMATGARCGEISNLELKDFDFTQQKVNITPEKGSNPRTIPIKHPEILEMVKKLPPNQNPLRKNKLFADADDMRSNFFVQRKRAASKFQNPDMLKIHFHVYRHWNGTMVQRQTKDIFFTQLMLGHKNPQSTRRYMDTARIYGDASYDEWETRVADTAEDAAKLMEVGFEYHVEVEGHKLFRRKKTYDGLL